MQISSSISNNYTNWVPGDLYGRVCLNVHCITLNNEHNECLLSHSIIWLPKNVTMLNANSNDLKWSNIKVFPFKKKPSKLISIDANLIKKIPFEIEKKSKILCEKLHHLLVGKKRKFGNQVFHFERTMIWVQALL